MRHAIDENVLVVANDLSRLSRNLDPICPEASDACRLASADFLQSALASGFVILDTRSEYFDKYRAHCSLEGQPGVGDMFLQMVFARGYTDWAHRVEIRGDNGSYCLPEEILQSGFDNDDFLWLAGALNAEQPASVVNAVDSDYGEHTELLNSNGVTVVELCLGPRNQ